MDWRRSISHHFPWIPAFKREFVAARDSIVATTGGSQCGEDLRILKWLFDRGIAPTETRYVEVGANQPTQLSNTWRLYQGGGRGMLIEPDSRCTPLLRRWRPRDLVIEAMAGQTNGASTLFLHKHTTMNASAIDNPDLFIGQRLVPIVMLDSLEEALSANDHWPIVHLVSIDTEGSELSVLAGAQSLLRKTLLVCLEHWGSKQLIEKFRSALPSGFEIAFETRMNVVFSKA